jgi:hypothetical protein
MTETLPAKRLIAYARGRTYSQTLDALLDQLWTAGCAARTMSNRRAFGTGRDLAAELHKFKRRNETPVPLIEMFAAQLSLDPRLSGKQRRKKTRKIMVAALERLERKDA